MGIARGQRPAGPGIVADRQQSAPVLPIWPERVAIEGQQAVLRLRAQPMQTGGGR